MNAIVKFLCNRRGELVFSLLSGVAYFIVVLQLVGQYSNNGSLLLGFFFCPAVICGVALMMIKLLRSWKEQELYQRMTALFVAHAVLFIISLVLLAGLLFS